MNSKKSNFDPMKINIDIDVATRKIPIPNNIDFIIYVSKLIETNLDDVINTIANEKLDSGCDLNKLRVSLEIIKTLVKEIHFKLPDSIDNGYTFGRIPIFEDDIARLENLHKILTLNSISKN